MTKVLSVVYHSGYGHTAKVAEAVAEGARSAGATVHVLKAHELSDADWTTLDASDAIVFGAPTYMGGVSAPFKAFIDATSKRWFGQAWKDKIAAGFTNSGNYSGDKLASLQQLMHLGMQHGMIWVGQAEMSPTFAEGELPTHDKINRLGSNTGLMTQANQKSGADVAPPEGDIETARRFGKRVAEVTQRFSG